MFLFCDIEQETLIAVDFPGCVTRRETALQRGHSRSIFAPQIYFEVPHKIIGLDLTTEYAALLGRGIELCVHIAAQQFFAAGMTQHAHERVIAVEQFAIRRCNKHPFLHLLE